MSINQQSLFPFDEFDPSLAEDELMPFTVAERLEMAIQHEQFLRDQARRPREQELCLYCAVDDDPATEPGVPQDVVGHEDRYPFEEEVVVLACGHRFVRPMD